MWKVSRSHRIHTLPHRVSPAEESSHLVTGHFPSAEETRAHAMYDVLPCSLFVKRKHLASGPLYNWKSFNEACCLLRCMWWYNFWSSHPLHADIRRGDSLGVRHYVHLPHALSLRWIRLVCPTPIFPPLKLDSEPQPSFRNMESASTHLTAWETTAAAPAVSTSAAMAMFSFLRRCSPWGRGSHLMPDIDMEMLRTS